MQLLGRQRRILSPLSPSPLPLRVSIKKEEKKVSVAARQSVHPSERSPTLQSSSGLCVPQIENEQQSTVGEVSQPLKVMALASRLAGRDNAVPSLPGSDSWLSKKKQKKNSELVPARLGAGYILDAHVVEIEHFGSGRQQTCAVDRLDCWARHAP